MGHVVDRWTVPDPDRPGKRVRGPRWGKGQRWLARWVEPDGRERARACPSKDAALALVGEVGVAIRGGSYAVAGRGPTLAEYAGEWLAGQVHVRPSTRETMERRLRVTVLPLLGEERLGSVTRADVQAAVAVMGEGLAPATVRLAYTYLRAVFAAAVDDGLVPISPCRRINLPAVDGGPVRPLTVAQVLAIADALVVAVPVGGDGRRVRRLGHLRALVLVGAGSGLRPGELRGLTVDRVTGDGLRVDRQLVGASGRVPRFGPVKTASSVRVVPLAAVTRRELERHLAERGAGPEGLVFTDGRGWPLTRGHLHYAWAAATVGLGLPDRSGFHDLRHHHASLLIGSGLSPRAVADRLGHADPSETLRTYAHLWPSDQARIVAAVEAAYGSVSGP